jgi:hypothetical protein
MWTQEGLPMATRTVVVALAASAAVGALTRLHFSGGPPPAPSVAVDVKPPVAVDVKPAYRIVKTGGDRDKDIWQVELSRKVGMPELRSIAEQIRRERGTGTERAYLWFFLPGNPASPWAYASFEPGLKVEIQGFTIEEEAELIGKAPRHAGATGCWIVDDCDRRMLTIYRDAGGLHLETTMLGGTLGDQELIEAGPPEGRRFERRAPSKAGDHYLNLETTVLVGTLGDQELIEAGPPEGRRFERRAPSKAGDHYLIDEKGDLELRDSHGLIAVARRVAKP